MIDFPKAFEKVELPPFVKPGRFAIPIYLNERREINGNPLYFSFKLLGYTKDGEVECMCVSHSDRVYISYEQQPIDYFKDTPNKYFIYIQPEDYEREKNWSAAVKEF